MAAWEIASLSKNIRFW